MYIMCVCLFSALSRRVGALQTSIIIIINGCPILCSITNTKQYFKINLRPLKQQLSIPRDGRKPQIMGSFNGNGSFSIPTHPLFPPPHPATPPTPCPPTSKTGIPTTSLHIRIHNQTYYTRQRTQRQIERISQEQSLTSPTKPRLTEPAGRVKCPWAGGRGRKLIGSHRPISLGV